MPEQYLTEETYTIPLSEAVKIERESKAETERELRKIFPEEYKKDEETLRQKERELEKIRMEKERLDREERQKRESEDRYRRKSEELKEKEIETREKELQAREREIDLRLRTKEAQTEADIARNEAKISTLHPRTTKGNAAQMMFGPSPYIGYGPAKTGEVRQKSNAYNMLFGRGPLDSMIGLGPTRQMMRVYEEPVRENIKEKKRATIKLLPMPTVGKIKK